MIIANFTPDVIKWMHLGQDGKLLPGKYQEFEEARGKHILNKFGARGLVRLEFGDDPAEKKKVAMEIYKEFWIRQITRFNQDNEQRQNMNRPYVEPTKEIKAKAAELGLEVVGPWTYRPDPNTESSKLRDENLTLKQEVDRLGAMVGGLIETLEKRGIADLPDELKTTTEKVALAEKEEEVVVEASIPMKGQIDEKDPFGELKHKIKFMGKDMFSKFILGKTADDINAGKIPPEVVDVLKARWADLYVDPIIPWPLPD